MGGWGWLCPTMVCQWGIGWNKNSKKLIDMDCPWSCNVVHGATRGGGLRKNMIGETPCNHFRNSVSTSIIWLSLFHRSLIISLHVGTSSVVLSPRGCSDSLASKWIISDSLASSIQRETKGMPLFSEFHPNLLHWNCGTTFGAEIHNSGQLKN